VIIPHTNFNKNRSKLFFFTGFEYFYQVLDTGLLRATVPTSSEIGAILAVIGSPGRQHHRYRRPSRPVERRRPGDVSGRNYAVKTPLTPTCRR